MRQCVVLILVVAVVVFLHIGYLYSCSFVARKLHELVVIIIERRHTSYIFFATLYISFERYVLAVFGRERAYEWYVCCS